MPLHDYRQGRETIALGTKPITLAANFGESSGVPTLAFVFDNNAHGTHVAGIAAGHTLFNVAGFDGVAPGAQLDRKSTRLNSSHSQISYAVFCLKKKKNHGHTTANPLRVLLASASCSTLPFLLHLGLLLTAWLIPL